MNSRHSPPDAPPVESLLIDLRETTRPLHQALENTLDLTNPSLDRAGYGEILQIFLSYMGPWETAVGEALPQHLQCWFAPRRRARKLRLDLHAIAIDPDCHPFGDAPEIFVPRNLAQALGSMYVFEGSTLGAQTFVSKLALRMALDVDAGLDFFSGYREKTGSMWRDFRQTLQREVAVENFASAVGAACETFTTFRSWALRAKASN